MNRRLVFLIPMVCVISLNCSQKDPALIWVIRRGWLGRCEALVAQGCDVNTAVEGKFPIYEAIQPGSFIGQNPERCLSFLLEKKANPDLIYYNEDAKSCCTLLHSAVGKPLKRAGRIVRKLLAARADSTIEDKEGRTALDIVEHPLLKAVFVCQQDQVLEIGTPKHISSE